MIYARIQHHPSRGDLLPALLNGLASTPTEVVTDDHPELKSPWRNYRRCLEAPLPDDATHLLVIQDDATVCRDISRTLPLVARDVPVVLWLGGQPRRSYVAARRSADAGRRWSFITPGDWIPAVSVLWPTHLVRAPGKWYDENPRLAGVRPARADDGVLGAWARATSTPVLVTLPSLIEHPDTVASTIGKKAAGGRNRGRVAAFPIGDRSALELDWSDTP